MQRIVVAIGLLVAAFVQPGTLRAQNELVRMVQVRLTPAKITGFIAAQKEMSAITKQMRGSVLDKPDPKIQVRLEAISKKYGFEDFSEFDDTAATISLVMAGMAPETKSYADAPASIRNEINEVTADKTIPATEKKQTLEELNEALKNAATVQYPGNIELVKKYFDQIEAVVQ